VSINLDVGKTSPEGSHIEVIRASQASNKEKTLGNKSRCDHEQNVTYSTSGWSAVASHR
jgi:hypothetical protein